MTRNGFPIGGASPPTSGRPAVPTPAQRRFAAEHRGTAGIEARCPAGAMFVYGDNCIGAVRWLVDQDGAILERLLLD